MVKQPVSQSSLLILILSNLFEDYYTGLGACGWYNKDTDLIVAASYQIWNTWPGNTPSNPNTSPICKDVYVEITHEGKSVIAQVVDM